MEFGGWVSHYSILPLFQVGTMNEISTQVAFNGAALVEGAPGSISDPPESAFRASPGNGAIPHPMGHGGPVPYLAPSAPGSMGMLNMAWQGLRAASMLEKVEEVASVAQRQRAQQALLSELAGLQALMTVVGTGGQGNQNQGNQQQRVSSPQLDVPLSPRRKARQESTTAVNIVPSPSLRASRTSLTESVSYSRLRSFTAAPPGAPSKESSQQKVQEEDYDYSEDGFEEEAVESYHSSKSDILEEDVAVEGGSEENYSDDAFESIGVSLTRKRSNLKTVHALLM